MLSVKLSGCFLRLRELKSVIFGTSGACITGIILPLKDLKFIIVKMKRMGNTPQDKKREEKEWLFNRQRSIIRLTDR